ncbi:MAG: hypothetical protein L6Q99_02750 [Planctomycetes bacterium]|nr:hypothetical protein [Planctomycetota bacterium]
MQRAALADLPVVWRWVLAAPLAACAVLALLARPEFVSVFVPVLGPWAGWLYGHHECTMGTVFVGGSLTLLCGLIAATVGWWRVRTLRVGSARTVFLSSVAIWIVAWSTLACLSVANSLS